MYSALGRGGDLLAVSQLVIFGSVPVVRSRSSRKWKNIRMYGVRSGRHADQAKHLVMALHHALRDLAEPGGIVLLFGLRLERASLGGHEQRVEAAVGHPGASIQVEDTRLVERLARRVVLLPIGFARLRVGRHDDARLCPVDARLP